MGSKRTYKKAPCFSDVLTIVVVRVHTDGAIVLSRGIFWYKLRIHRGFQIVFV